ncbi:MAG: hypothetical protein LBU65_05745 [Planctomycetaceae bacterium]|jgi:hypothetical protein|nr:hypothetical protein [Planctomycetaceae bacterium]
MSPRIAFLLLLFANNLFAADALRVLDGKHLRLTTDIPASAEVDALPALFDLAVPIWCEWFCVPIEKVADWKMEGCLVRDKLNFRDSGLLERVPELRTGFQFDNRLWVLEPKSDYYRRHLLLHEGVHGLMWYLYGELGPPWYREGLAELLSTHYIDGGKTDGVKLELAIIPRKREDVLLWGRVKLIHDDCNAGKFLTIDEVMTLVSKEYDDPNAYAWSWALTMFLATETANDNGGNVMLQMTKELSPTIPRDLKRFNGKVKELIGSEKFAVLQKRWYDFASQIDYGYDVQRTRIESFVVGKLIESGVKPVRVKSERGWQNSGYSVEKGKSYRLTASGRFALDNTPSKWWSQPNGITIRYHNGNPIGVLLMAVVTDKPDAGSAFMKPITVGSGIDYTATESGTIFFRINDSPNSLENNQGEAEVKFSRGIQDK